MRQHERHDVLERLAAANPVPAAGQAAADQPQAAALLRTVLADTADHETRPARPLRSAHRVRLIVPAGVALAVVAAGLVAVTRPAPIPHQVVVTAGPARTVLLAAAERAEQAAATPAGSYWHSRAELSELVHRDHDGNSYTVRVTYPEERWQPTGPGGRSTFVFDLAPNRVTIQPLTPADAAAYRRDGSPGLDEGADGGLSGVAADPAQGPRLAGERIYEGDASRLPTDPLALRNAMLDEVWSQGGWLDRFGRSQDRPRHPEAWLFREGIKLLDGVRGAVPARTRATVYRMLAGLPGVRSLGHVRDPAGRPAAGLALTEQTQEFGTVEWRLYVSEVQDLVLATEAVVLQPSRDLSHLPPRTVRYSRVIRSAGWTDQSGP